MAQYANGWMSFQNGRIYLELPKPVIASKDTPNHTKVYWLGNPLWKGETDGPCQNGRCVGIFQHSEVSGAWVLWDEQCKLHKGGHNPEKVAIEFLGIE